MIKKINVFLFIILFFGIEKVCFAQSLGEKFFKENNPKDAVQVLENEILNGQISANTYNFLGLGYYQIGEYEKSVDAFERGIKEQPANAKILYFNQGNSYYALKQFEKAAECFSLSYKADLSFVDALLNRANSYLMDDKLVLAKNDYVDYLEKFPETPQKNKIELLINAITDEIERRKEEERLLAEQNKALWEHINPNITEYDDENNVMWEPVDDEIAEIHDEKANMNWQEVGDNQIGKIEIPENKKKWEEIDNEKNSDLVDAEKQKSDENNDFQNFDEFEKVEDENEIPFAESVDDENEEIDKEFWENLSDEDTEELRKLEIQSEKEYEQWLKQHKLKEKRKQQEESLRKKMKEDEEKQKTQKLLEQMMKAENERRQKLLEDVQNSLQGNDSTNVSSGADDIIDYEYEGELD